MVRATLAGVQIRLAGDNPPGVTDADITSMLTTADNDIDGFTWPDVIGTDAIHVELANRVVMNIIAENTWFQAGGYLSGQPRPEILTPEIKDMLKRMQTISSRGGIGAIKSQPPS